MESTRKPGHYRGPQSRDPKGEDHPLRATKEQEPMNRNPPAGPPEALMEVDSNRLPAGGGDDAGSPLNQLKCEALRSSIVEVLRSCYDPEIPVDIYELGLIYDIQVEPTGNVRVHMTLTSPMCPVAGSLPPEVEGKVRAIEGVTSATVEVVWDPPWTPARMSEAAKLQLNMF